MSQSERIPSRAAFEGAVAFNRAQGHENFGFVSAEHGFLPSSPPLLSLPQYFQLWDSVAAELPSLFRNLKVRHTLDALPYLDVDSDHLPDRYLLRASSLVSILMHAYVRVEASSPPALPQHLMQAWEVISRRLERSAPFLSYVDLILYNWKLRDPLLPNPMQVENLDLLVPTVGNEEERIFYLTQVEIAAAGAPLLLSVIRAQEAVVRDDAAALEEELLRMLATFQHISEVAIHKIDPNPHSRTHVDPVVWAKTVAPFAVAVIPGRPGPSGTAAPIFHYMDAFFGRPAYNTFMGQEITNLLAQSPRHWRTLMDATAKVSVRDYIARSGSRSLQGLFDSVLEAYAGDKGYLGVHRLKAYGFLEIAFKAGRSLTIGGFKGLFRDKTWNQVDHELAIARDERYIGRSPYQHELWLTNGVVSQADPKSWTCFIQLETRDSNMRYRPGDRVSILPENSEELIRLTLDALHATGNETVKLNRLWQLHIQQRPGYAAGTTTLTMLEFLRFGRLRPVSRATAKALYAITASNSLNSILNARLEDQWELWDLLNMLAQGGFDTRRLWKAELWEVEHITRLIKPEVPRLYSIASAMNEDGTVSLNLAGLEYDSVESPESHKLHRKGTASSYLRRMVEESGSNSRLMVRLSPSARFHLPEDPRRPVVMFAGGSGIAPFIGFLQERSQTAEARNWLYLGIRTEMELQQRDLLERLAGTGQLQLRVALSREEKQLLLQNGRLITKAGLPRRVDHLIEQDSETLWKMIRTREEGGDEAQFYICGRTGFASRVMSGLHAVIYDHVESEEQANDLFRRLMADRRLMLDIFTTYSGVISQVRNIFDISEIVLHNNESHGYWMVLNGKVYDLTEFVHLHAGGKRILANNAGIDATRAYQSVQHHLNSEIDAFLGMYEIGRMRRLDFGMRWGVGLGPQGLFFFTLEEAFTAWVCYLYLIVEMENALANEFSFLQRATTRGESPEELTPLKVHLLAEAHARFIAIFLDGVLGEELDMLWAITTGLIDPEGHNRWMQHSIQELSSSQNAQVVRHNYLQQWLDVWRAETEMTSASAREAVRELCLLITAENQRCFNDLKLTIRTGVQVFEKYEAQVMEQGGTELLTALRQIPHQVTQAYYERLAGGIETLANQYDLSLQRTHLAEETVTQFIGHGAQIDDDELKKAVPDSE